MPSDADFDLREALLNGWADQNGIAQQVEALLYMCLRGWASQNPYRNLDEIVSRISFTSEIIKRCVDLNVVDLFRQVTERLMGEAEDVPILIAINEVARRGFMLFVESSASDNGARARASKCRHSLLEAIADLNELMPKGRSWP